MKNPIRIKKYNRSRFYGKDRNIQILLVISLTISVLLILFGILSFLGNQRLANKYQIKSSNRKYF